MRAKPWGFGRGKIRKTPHGGRYDHRAAVPFSLMRLCLGAACTECILLHQQRLFQLVSLCLGAACTECILFFRVMTRAASSFASALPARSASDSVPLPGLRGYALPRRCLHGVHPPGIGSPAAAVPFASALPARSASCLPSSAMPAGVFASALPARSASSKLVSSRGASTFASALPARSASAKVAKPWHTIL